MRNKNNITTFTASAYTDVARYNNYNLFWGIIFLYNPDGLSKERGIY